MPKILQKSDVKNQMLNTVYQKTQTNVNIIYQICQHVEKVMEYSKKTKQKSESVTVPKQFKTPEFHKGKFFLH